jgi:hypothetical protein
VVNVMTRSFFFTGKIRYHGGRARGKSRIRHFFLALLLAFNFSLLFIILFYFIFLRLQILEIMLPVSYRIRAIPDFRGTREFSRIHASSKSAVSTTARYLLGIVS